MSGIGPNTERALIFPPTRRDGEVTTQILGEAGVQSEACTDWRVLAQQVHEGVGVVVLTDNALADPHIGMLLSALSAQPTWSDIPVVLLAHAGPRAPSAAAVLALLTNVTLLDLPTSTATLISAVLAALRARRRQYQIRDQLARQRAAEEALREADRRKDEFLATLAHELRNPLAPIRTGLQALGMLPNGDERAAQLRGMMTRQVGQLVKLTDELLDVSRITTGKVVLQCERVDLRSVIEHAIESSQPVVDAGGHQLRCVLPQQPVWVLGDPFRLAQAVCNLLNNAAKYTPAGGSIGVHLAHEGDGARATVRVSDTGAGIPPEMLERVFDLFTQAHRTMDRAQGGLGIGLSLVRHIVHLHGGSVFAQSPGPERGSTFVIQLPLVDGPPAGAAASFDAECAGTGRSLRLLLVDDNADAADSLAILLQSEGHEVRTEYSGATALRAVAEFEPQVVLCDIGLPGMDGNAVARRIRADEHHGSTVLVAVTGWGSDGDRGRSRDAGFDFHLVKPVSLASIREILAKIQR